MLNLAFRGCLAVFLYFPLALHAQEKPEEQTAPIEQSEGAAPEAPAPDNETAKAPAEQQPQATKPLTPALTVQGERATEPTCDARCQEAEQREKADLKAQRDMAGAAAELIIVSWWQFWAGGAGIALLIYTLYLTRNATKAAIEANRIARKSAERQLRAYVFLTKASIENWAAGEQPFAHLTVVNTGQTPAYGVEFWAAVQIVTPDKVLPDFERPANLHTSRYSLGTNIPTYKKMPISDKPMTEDIRHAIVGGDLTVFVWGEITYRDIFKKYRASPFRLKFSGIGDPPRNDMTAMEEGNDPT